MAAQSEQASAVTCVEVLGSHFAPTAHSQPFKVSELVPYFFGRIKLDLSQSGGGAYSDLRLHSLT